MLSVVPAGSFRRRRRRSATSTCSPRPTHRASSLDAFTGLGVVDHVVNRGAVQGGRPPAARAAGRPHGHAARRGRHVPHPLHGLEGAQRPAARPGPRPRLEPVREGLPAHRRGRRAADRRRGRAAHVRRPRQEAYAFLDLPFIEPELREDEGEIEAALAGRLPHLVELGDLRGDLHTPLGLVRRRPPIEVMAEAARRRGHAYQVLTDHSMSLAIARGLAPDRVEQQRAIIAELNERFAAGGARGHGSRRDAARRASACCTAASWRSAPTGTSTTPTSCSRGSTSSSPRSTSVAASRAPS